MHLQKSLEGIGFRQGEVKVYLAALDLGESTISDIAQSAGMPRTSAQFIIKELQKKGMMNYYIRRRRKYWMAENPEKLLSNIREKENILKDIMPQLRAMRYEVGARPVMRSYTGTDGIKIILNDILDTKRDFLSLTSMEDAVALLDDNFRDFIEKRFSHHLRVRFLTKKSPETEAMRRRDMAELRNTRFLPDTFELHNANFIYGNKIAIIALNKKMPSGMVIEDKGVAQTMAALFEIAWAQSE